MQTTMARLGCNFLHRITKFDRKNFSLITCIILRSVSTVPLINNLNYDISANWASRTLVDKQRVWTDHNTWWRRMFSLQNQPPSTNVAMEKIWEEKTRLRSEMKRKVASMTVEEKERQSEIVRQKLYNHDVYKKSKSVSVFLSMDDEIRTLDILRQLFADNKTVYIPRYSGKLGRMDMVLLESWADYESLPVTRWNIKQPPTDDDRPEALQSGGLDLVIMPGLAFTEKGARLGRGKGYYDSFLTRAATSPYGKPYTIAVAFKQQIVPHIPTTDSDFIINEVLHEDS